MTSSAPYLLSGSFAYDTILRHDGLFQTHIMPEALGRLSVSFDIGSSRREFGGTAGNIAYNAALLGQHPCLVGILGHDRADYLSHLTKQGHDIETLTRTSEHPTAHAWIASDAADNQLTFFQMGALNIFPRVPVETPALWHLAPENPLSMARMAHHAISENIPFFFDPGQVTPAFVAGATNDILPLEDMLYRAQGIFVNDYEADLLKTKTGKSLGHWLTEEGQFIVHTRGGDGLDLHVVGHTEAIPVAPAKRIIDPTGCGDALRAGFLFGYSNGWSLRDCALLGSVMGAFAIEHGGGQNHIPTVQQIADRFVLAERKVKAEARSNSWSNVREATLTLQGRPTFSPERRNQWLAQFAASTIN